MDRSTGRRGSTIALAALGVALSWCAPEIASAQLADRPRVSVSGLVGVARPADATFREIYGSTATPVTVQMDWRLGDAGAEVFGGVRYVGQAGEGISDSAPSSGEPLTFHMTSVRFGVGWSFPSAGWRFTVAGGGSYNAYRESWKDLGIETKDSAFGVVVQTTVSRQITRRIGLLARMEFSAIGAEPIDPSLRSVNLGSLDLLAGVSFAF